MTTPYILNQFERAAIEALTKSAQLPAAGNVDRNFGRIHLENLRRLGLACLVPSKAGQRDDDYAITDNGWLCIYGLSKAQIAHNPELKPVPFRVWQWPPAGMRRAT